MSDDKNTPKGDETPKNPIDGGNQGGADKPNTDDSNKGGGDDPKTFTQEEVNSLISERIKREQDKFEKSFSEKLEKEKAEAERLAKLSATEKEQELRQKEKKEFEIKQKELTLKENRLDGRIKLDELGMPKEFVEFVINEDADKMSENIELLKKSWDDAVNQAVKAKLAGTTPKAPTGNDSKPVATERKNYF